MFQAGYAQEIITPPTGVGLGGYFNQRPNQGMYDDLMVKVLILESKGTRFGFVAFDLLAISQVLLDTLNPLLEKEFGKELVDNLILSCTHSHTGPEYRPGYTRINEERTTYALQMTAEAACRAVRRAIMNLLPAEIETGSFYNNPYGFVRRYFMKNGTIVTNPGWGNPDIEKPECNYDRTINILKVVQGGRPVALLCNIANHGDTIGGDIVSADWYGRFTQAVQYALKSSLPVLVVDDASGNINHFDFNQKINQTSYNEAVRIGRGYAQLVLEQLDHLTPLKEEDVVVSNVFVEIPHYQLTQEEVAYNKNILATVPDIKKEGDLESQDLANRHPAALRHFAQRALDCYEKSTPSHPGRITSIKLGTQLGFVSIPGEPFNGIAQAIRQASPCKQTFVITLAQTPSGYIPMKECFARGGYEVQPGVNTASPEAADVLIQGAIQALKK